MVKLRILPSLIPKDLPVYESCIEGKMTKRLFTAKKYRDKEYMELLHTNICKTFNVHAREGMNISSHIHIITLSLNIFT